MLHGKFYDKVNNPNYIFYNLNSFKKIILQSLTLKQILLYSVSPCVQITIYA